VKLLREVENRVHYDPLCYRAAVAHRIDADTVIAHFAFKATNWCRTSYRDFCALAHVRALPDGTAAIVGRSVNHSSCPPDPSGKVVRAKLMFSGFIIRPVYPDSSEANLAQSPHTASTPIPIGRSSTSLARTVTPTPRNNCTDTSLSVPQTKTLRVPHPHPSLGAAASAADQPATPHSQQPRLSTARSPGSTDSSLPFARQPELLHDRDWRIAPDLRRSSSRLVAPRVRRVSRSGVAIEDGGACASRVIYAVHCDLRGSVPNWIKNLVATKQPLLVRDLREFFAAAAPATAPLPSPLPTRSP